MKIRTEDGYDKTMFAVRRSTYMANISTHRTTDNGGMMLLMAYWYHEGVAEQDTPEFVVYIRNALMHHIRHRIKVPTLSRKKIFIGPTHFQTDFFVRANRQTCKLAAQTLYKWIENRAQENELAQKTVTELQEWYRNITDHFNQES
jgi:hypothetical protein